MISYRDIIKRKDRPNACKDSLGRLRVGAAVGVTPDLFARIEALLKAGVDVVSIDTAHGHSKGVIDALKGVKKTFLPFSPYLVDSGLVSGIPASQEVPV